MFFFYFFVFFHIFTFTLLQKLELANIPCKVSCCLFYTLMETQSWRATDATDMSAGLKV